MNDIKKVAILGAGAMGAFFSSKFFQAQGFTTSLIAKGERLERLKQNGLIVNGEHYLIPAENPDLVSEPADLIIVALKHHHLDQALPDLKNLVGEKTTIVSVMNGLDSEPMIGAVYGMDKVLYAVSVGIDALRDGNRVQYSKPGKHYFGEAENRKVSQRVLRVQDAFKKADIDYETPEDMTRIMWWKFMINVGMNPSSAVMGAPYGVFQTSQQAQDLMNAMMQEVIKLARAEKTNLTEQDLTDWYAVLKGLSPQGKTSMLQDVEAGQKTEIEIFCEKVVNLGKKHSIPTPVNLTIMQIVKVIEQQFT